MMPKTTIEPALSTRLRRLSAAEREALLTQLAMSQTTFYRRLNFPGEFTLDEAEAIRQYLEHLDGEDLDMFQMLRPVEVAA